MGRELIGRHQELALQFLILMPYLSMQVETAEVELVQQFAQACSAPAPHLERVLKQVHKGQLRGLLWDYSVRSLVKLLTRRMVAKTGMYGECHASIHR